MPDTDLSITTIGGGALAEDFNRALQRVFDDVERDPDLKDAVRTISVKVTIQDSDKSGYFVTKHSVTTTLPAKKTAGIAWVDGDAMRTSSQVRSEDAQLELDGSRSDKVTPINRRTGGAS